MFESPTLPSKILSEVKKNEKKYQKMSQIAYYLSLEDIGKKAIFTKSMCDVECNVVFCFSPEKITNQHKKNALYFVAKTLDEEVPNLKNKFSIAYLHDSLKEYKNFRNFLELLPAAYLIKLKSLYIVNGGTSLKFYSKLFFGPINSYIEEKLQYINNLEQLEIKTKLTLCSTLKSQIKLESETIKPEQNEPDTQFPQIIKNELYGRQIYQYQLTEYKIPKIIFCLIGRLFSNPQFLQKQGIMRKSCNVEILQTLEDSLLSDENPFRFIHEFQDYDVVAGCIKKILNNLNTPLFNYELYEKIIDYRNDGIHEQTINFLNEIISQMGQVNREVFLFLIGFFREGIIKYQQINKMSPYNLAVVFGPCFFRPKQYNLEDLLSSGKFCSFVKLFIDNYSQAINEQKQQQIHKLLQISKKPLSD